MYVAKSAVFSLSLSLSLSLYRDFISNLYRSIGENEEECKKRKDNGVND